MSSAVAAMSSSISSGSTEHHRVEAEAGPRGFTAVNITPPQSRESSATSPDVSPRESTAGAGRHGSNWHVDGHESSHKRRRSMSSEHGLPSPRRYDYNPPKRLETQQQHLADRALHVLDSTTNQPTPHSYYSTPSGHERAGYGYERPYSGHSGVQPSTPEGRLAEAFSRESADHHYASSANGGDNDRNEDGGAQGLQPGQKRKRNFSNRTKTGCITCRGRKKKCDEARPHCNNCIRGGFPCQGYNQSRPGTYFKPTPQKQSIPLQSKENDEQSPYQDSSITPVSANPSSAEAHQMRSKAVQDGHDQSRPQYVPNPSTPAELRPSYSGPPQHQHHQWPQQNHHTQSQQGPPSQPSYSQDHLPPLSELSRSEQPQQQHHHQPPAPEYTNTPQREMSRQHTQAQHSAGPPPSAVSAPSHWQQHPQQQQGPPPAHQQQQQQQQQQPPPPAHQQQPYHQQQQSQHEYGRRPHQPYPPPIDTAQPAPQYTRGINTAHTANTASTATPAATYSTPSYATPSNPYNDSKSSSSSYPKTFTSEDVERSKMLRGASYNYFDPTLKNERQRCANALLRYNNACQWGSGVSDEELQTMLLKVFHPVKDKTHSFLAPIRLEGSLGPGVKIEAGFRCTYGYNMRIYDNVFIGEHTRIDDSAKVEIGARSWIGADVTILTNDVNRDMVGRQGTNGQACTASPVVIGSECIIGPGAVIYPGVKLGRCSTVEAFAIVKTDLPDHETQRANSGARVHGGI